MGNAQPVNGDGSYATDARGITTTSVQVPYEEWKALNQKVNEIHAFMAGIGQALNHPMLKAMLPAEMQSMIPRNKG